MVTAIWQGKKPGIAIRLLAYTSLFRQKRSTAVKEAGVTLKCLPIKKFAWGDIITDLIYFPLGKILPAS